MISRARALLTGLTALAALLAAVVGLPLVLYRFGGSPLPRHLAGWHHLTSVLTSKDNGTVLLAAVRDLSWLAWLLFTVAVLAELQAVLRGRSAPRLWLGGLQGGAARLVALAALTFAASPAVALTASAAPLAHVHTGPSARDGDQQGEGLTLMSFGRRDTSPDAATRSVTVRPGDCLWSIAERYLGAGDRYPEIASMNFGHDMGDGRVFTNPSLIEPGWQLRLPGSADPAGPAPASAASASTDGTATGAAHHLGHPTKDPHYRRRHATASQPVPVSQPASVPASAPSSSAAGPASQQPDPVGYQNAANESAAADRLPEAAVFVTGVLAGAVLTSLNRLRRKQRQYRRRGRRIPLPADPHALAAERTLRAAASQAGPVSTLPDALACLETGMLDAGHVLPDIVGLHVTPEVLEVLLAAPALDSPPPPYAISPGRQGMCWQLELPAYGPEGSGAPGGPGAPGVNGSGLLPGLFTAGGTDAGYLLLDLESLQVTGCDGPAALVDQVVTAAATELATGQWSGWYDLVLVGFDELSVLGRAEHFATLADALQLLDERCQAVSARLADAPPADVRQLRLTAPEDEDWGLTLLVSRIEPTADQLTHLLELAEDGPGGIAALVAGDPETADGRMAPTVLQLAPDPQHPGEILANVIPLQITVRPQTLSDAEYQAISTLFAVAADLNDVSPEQVPYAVYAAPPWIPEAVALAPEPDSPYPPWAAPADLGDLTDPADRADALDPERREYGADHHQDFGDELAGPDWHDSSEFRIPSWPAAPARAPATPAEGFATPPWASQPAAVTQPRLEVRVLGPLAITGAVEQLQPKQAELVLALALAAPAGVSNSALCTMLGADPDHPKPSDAVRQIITRTRRRLGRASDGREYIIHSGNGNYLLHPDVWLDWTEFRCLTAGSRADDMRAALAMVRGEPFAGSYYWWIDIPLLETVRAEIVDAAETLGEFELTTGSPRAAARAARSGLAAEVSAEQLWRLLMRAEHATGNAAGVAEAWRNCLDAIEDIAPGGEPHPDTDALYRQLTAANRQHQQVRG